MNEWTELLKTVTVIVAGTTTALVNLRKFLEREPTKESPQIEPDPARKNPDIEVKAYQHRVRSYRKVDAYRPEWDLLGRVVFNGEGKQIITEMDRVPDNLKATMTTLLETRGIRPGAEHAKEVSDGIHHYLLEIGTDSETGTEIFAFFRQPAR